MLVHVCKQDLEQSTLCTYYARCVLRLWRHGFLEPGEKKWPSRKTIYGWRHRNRKKRRTNDYTRLLWIAGSSWNHVICICPTTNQETCNDGYNTHLVQTSERKLCHFVLQLNTLCQGHWINYSFCGMIRVQVICSVRQTVELVNRAGAQSPPEHVNN